MSQIETIKSDDEIFYKNLICNGCNTIYYRPLVLPCGNTLCYNCVEKYKAEYKQAHRDENSAAVDGDSYKCLFCPKIHKDNNNLFENKIIAEMVQRTNDSKNKISSKKKLKSNFK
jgi:hypothetical protein